MNDKRLIKALIVSGSIATGFALNSTGAMAAELDDAAVNNNVADNGEQDVVNEKVQALNEAVDVVEGDAVAAESYLYTAQESIDNNLMTEDKAAEILNGSAAVMEQAKEKNDAVQSQYATAVADEAAAKEEFEKLAVNSGLEAFATECSEIENAHEKIAVIDKALEASNNNFQSFIETNSEVYEAYNALIDDVNDTENRLSKAENSYDYYKNWFESDATKTKLEEAYQAVAEIEDTEYPYSFYLSERAKIDEQTADLKEELAQADIRLSEIVASGDYDEDWLEGERMWYAGASNFIGNWYFALEDGISNIWGEEIYNKIHFLSIYEERERNRDLNNKTIAECKEKLERLTSDENYKIIVEEKKKIDDFAIAADNYKSSILAKSELTPSAERSQQAYDRTVAAYTETINLLNAQAENGNTQAPTEEASEEITEQTALSEDVYTVFNNVKAIVMENPELLQKVYALYNNEKAVETVKYAYNYVVANVDISTINHYAKQLAGMDITPEVVNTYLDMFTNWVNK